MKLFSSMLALALAAGALSGCARKDASLGLLDVAEMNVRLDFDRQVIRPVSGKAVIAAGALKKAAS